jgi:hypothetical protein
LTPVFACTFSRKKGITEEYNWKASMTCEETGQQQLQTKVGLKESLKEVSSFEFSFFSAFLRNKSFLRGRDSSSLFLLLSLSLDSCLGSHHQRRIHIIILISGFSCLLFLFNEIIMRELREKRSSKQLSRWFVFLQGQDFLYHFLLSSFK